VLSQEEEIREQVVHVHTILLEINAIPQEARETLKKL
jgi:hypothetical protein